MFDFHSIVDIIKIFPLAYKLYYDLVSKKTKENKKVQQLSILESEKERWKLEGKVELLQEQLQQRDFEIYRQKVEQKYIVAEAAIIDEKIV